MLKFNVNVPGNRAMLLLLITEDKQGHGEKIRKEHNNLDEPMNTYRDIHALPLRVRVWLPNFINVMSPGVGLFNITIEKVEQFDGSSIYMEFIAPNFNVASNVLARMLSFAQLTSVIIDYVSFSIYMKVISNADMSVSFEHSDTVALYSFDPKESRAYNLINAWGEDETNKTATTKSERL